MGIMSIGFSTEKAGAARGRSMLPVGNPQQYRWLEGIVKALLVLNLLDAVFTLFWVWTGLAKEANVLLQDLVTNHPVLFVLLKISLVSLGSFLLWRRRNRPAAVIALFFVFFVYYSLLLYHLRFMGRVLAYLMLG